MKRFRLPPCWRQYWRREIKPLLLLVLGICAVRSSFADWNDVPTGSMKPTILEGDRVWVNKLAYDLKVPFTTWHLAEWGNPARGDIVVFFSPADGKRLVKRMVGLPGDTVAMANNLIFINGKPATYAPLDTASLPDMEERLQSGHLFTMEQLGTRNHPVMISPQTNSIRSFPPVNIPPGRFFVMGDNRDNSFDSRYFGLVERRRIVGRATAVVASLDRDHSSSPRWHRTLKPLP